MSALVSVILVTHNAGDFLRPAVESVLRQTYQRLELLLVDNASSDGSVSALQTARSDPRVHLIPSNVNLFHNGGLQLARSHVQGDFVAIMDADDVSHPRRLERQLDLLAQHAEMAGTGCAAETIDGQGRHTGIEFTLCRPGDIAAFLPYNMPFIFPSLMLRREVFEQFPFRDGLAMAHDLDVLARVAERHRLGCVPEVLFSYRRHTSATSTSRLRELFAYGCVVRVATARRRSGRDESFDTLLKERTQLLTSGASIGQIFLHYSETCRSEGHLALAAFHARQALRHQQRAKGAWQLAAALRAMLASRADRNRQNLRVALFGPLRGLGLQPFQPANEA